MLTGKDETIRLQIGPGFHVPGFTTWSRL